MKVLVTSQGNRIDSPIDMRFGRCAYFIVVNTDNMEFQAYRNPAFEAMGGAGVQAVQFVSGLDVKAVITGALGPSAFHALSNLGISGYSVDDGSATVKDAVETFKEGKLRRIEKAAQAHRGMGGKFGRGGRG